MAKISLDKKEDVKKLRELVGSPDLFPFCDYLLDDTTIIGITLYKRSENGFLDGSSEYVEDKHGLLNADLREAIIREMWKVNFDSKTVEKMKELGIEIVYPDGKRRLFGR